MDILFSSLKLQLEGVIGALRCDLFSSEDLWDPRKLDYKNCPLSAVEQAPSWGF